ncbi:coilin, partial [Biomphalaria glabrata]
VIELSENYNPTLSGFKEAKVLSVNADIDALQVELIGKVKKRQPGKFDLDDTCCSEEIDNIVTLNISELLEVMFLRTAIQ